MQIYLKTHREGEEEGEREKAYILEKTVMCDIVILQIEQTSYWKNPVLSKLLKSSKYRQHPVLFAQTNCNYRVIGPLAAIFKLSHKFDRTFLLEPHPPSCIY